MLLDESNSSRRPSSPGPRASAADKPRHKFDSGAAPGRITAVNGCDVQSAIVQAAWGSEAYGHDNYFNNNQIQSHNGGGMGMEGAAKFGIDCSSPLKSRRLIALQETLLHNRADGRRAVTATTPGW